MTISVFDTRTQFLGRLADRGSIASLAAMVMDREYLLSLGFGWNSELIEATREHIDLREADLLSEDEVSESRAKLVDLLRMMRVRRFEGSASSFILDFFPHAFIPRDFALFLGDLPYESVRIFLIFMANMFQFTYLRTTNKACPFCSGQLSSEHFFLCDKTPAPFNDWGSLVVEFRAREYWKAMDRIFLTLQRWSAICNKFTPGFGEKIQEYFQSTEIKARRIVPSRLAR
jgi:hypothetical protein